MDAAMCDRAMQRLHCILIIPHGPHPGRAEASIGAKYTDELAVMMDSFRPLKVAKQARTIEDPSYHRSWIDAQHAGFNPPTT